MQGRRYPDDPTDEQWTLAEPLIQKSSGGWPPSGRECMAPLTYRRGRNAFCGSGYGSANPTAASRESTALDGLRTWTS
jgi:hypothetical protein